LGISATDGLESDARWTEFGRPGITAMAFMYVPPCPSTCGALSQLELERRAASRSLGMITPSGFD
jgi:hypothetical protein